MSSLFERVRSALAPGYAIERELGGGGMAVVYRGHDPALDRPVAIKVLRPELASALGAERFLREARTIARLSHPNVISIHEVGEADGLYYYVMDLVEGETLRARLRRGPLPAGEAVSLGLDLLSALEAVHGIGVVHRDVKPDNVFLTPGRALLGDLGIAREAAARGETLTTPGARPGTPEYMAPEQLAGEDATPRSDIYAAAATLYEAFTGRRWRWTREPAKADWSGVPGRIARVLKRGLQGAPGARWTEAAAFRRALAAARAPKWAGRPARALTLAAAAALLLILWRARVADRGPAADDEAAYDLAVLPCETIPLSDSAVGESLARLAHQGLQGLPMLRVAPFNTASRWWRAARLTGEPGAGRAAAALGAHYATRCQMVDVGSERAEVRLELVDREGSIRPLRTLRGPAIGATYVLGDSLALDIIGTLLPGEAVSGQALTSLSGHDVQAVRFFLLGEHEFLADRRRRAESYYRAAVQSDSTLSVAWWRLADTRRWLSLPPGMDLKALLEEHGADLGDVDRSLLAARVAPAGPARMARYADALRRHPRDAYAALIYGDELFHRGPLWGLPLDSAVTVLRLAVERDSFLAPAFEHLVLAGIRLGGREDARRWLDHLERIDGDRSGAVDLFHPALLEQAYLERFAPDSARRAREVLFGEAVPDIRDLLADVARFGGPYLDLAEAQVDLGRLLVRDAGPAASTRVSGELAQAVALTALGRYREALERTDAAASAQGTPEGRLRAAEWRVVPAALELRGVEPAEIRRSADSLDRIARDSTLASATRARAAWALALLALRTGDRAGGARWTRLLESLSPPDGRLLRFARAAALGAAGEYRPALRATAPLLAGDSAAKLLYPFSRAALHLVRGEWFDALGAPDSARAEWLWYESSDLEGVPAERVQAGELDWALGTHGRLRRAGAALAGGQRDEACRLSNEALRLWRDADSALAPEIEEARAIRSRSCPK